MPSFTADDDKLSTREADMEIFVTCTVVLLVFNRPLISLLVNVEVAAPFWPAALG
jgi:hypothetical protein